MVTKFVYIFYGSGYGFLNLSSSSFNLDIDIDWRSQALAFLTMEVLAISDLKTKMMEVLEMM